MKTRDVVPLLLTVFLIVLVGLNALVFCVNEKRSDTLQDNIETIRQLQKKQEQLTKDRESVQEEIRGWQEEKDSLQETYEKREDEIALMKDTFLLKQLYVEEKQTTVDGYRAAEKIDAILLSLHNEFREGLGLNTLEYENFLLDVATLRSEEAHELWSHTRPDGSWCLDLIPLSRPAAENLSYIKRPYLETDESYCRSVAEKVFQSLLDSPTHYDNIVKSNMKHIGIRTYVTREAAENRFQFTTAYIFSN